jgi:hypothetical protein
MAAGWNGFRVDIQAGRQSFLDHLLDTSQNSNSHFLYARQKKR